MAQTKYTYSISNDTANSSLAAGALKTEYEQSSIVTALDYISSLGDVLDIYTKDALSTADESTLNSVVAAHEGVENLPPDLEIDSDGRQIVKAAATIKGWHYQAHAIEFETSKLNSIYNKDADEVDLGFAAIKFYDTNGTELTTQTNIDSSCVKTVLTWNADYDFQLTSGQLRQISNQNNDIYLHVHAKVLIAAPSTFLTVPFTMGGINMRYIGADEPLITDGRAPKSFTSNDKFEIICNHAAGIQHKMTIIFETYKSPV